MPISQALAQGLSTGALQNAQGGADFGPSAPSRGNPGAAIDLALSQGIRKLQFPQDLPKYYMSLYISDFVRQSLTTVGHLKLNEVIRLPLPLNLDDYHAATWEEYNYGMIAGVADDWFGIGVAGWASMAVNFAGGLVGGAAEQTVNITNSLAGGAIRGPAGVYGVAPNMFQTILYRGPRFKEPKFALRLFPRNLAESTQIRNIINRLNIAMAPSFNRIAGNLLFNFPDIFQIAYWPNSGWLYKFKPCVLKVMHVNYTGQDHKVAFYAGAAGKRPGPRGGFINDGSNNPPESVEIELVFQELEYWTKENFQQVPDNNPFSGVNIPVERAPVRKHNR